MQSAVGTSSVGPGVMPAQVLGGPVWWFVFGLYIFTIGFAVFVLADSLRRKRRERLAEIREPGWLYTAFAAVYLACVVAAWIPAMPRVFAAVPVILTPFSIAAGMAYLLRVVFPKQVRLADTGTGFDVPSPTDTDARVPPDDSTPPQT